MCFSNYKVLTLHVNLVCTIMGLELGFSYSTNKQTGDVFFFFSFSVFKRYLFQLCRQQCAPQRSNPFFVENNSKLQTVSAIGFILLKTSFHFLFYDTRNTKEGLPMTECRQLNMTCHISSCMQ